MADPVEEGSEEGPLAGDARRGPCGLDQRAPDVAIPLAGSSGMALTAALGVTRAEPTPTGQVSCRWKSAHINANLGDQSPGRQLLHTRHLTQALYEVTVGLHAFGDPAFQQFHLACEPVQFFQQFAQQEPEMI